MTDQWHFPFKFYASSFISTVPVAVALSGHGPEMAGFRFIYLMYMYCERNFPSISLLQPAAVPLEVYDYQVLRNPKEYHDPERTPKRT